MQLAALLLKLLIRFVEALSDNILRDLLYVDVALRQLVGELLAEQVALAERRGLGVLEDGATLDHLVLMGHHTAQILRGQEHKVVVVPSHLLFVDAGFARDQVEQLVRLLPRALVLARVLFDQLRELGRAGSHSPFVLLLSVVRLRLALELLNDLVLLPQLEVHLAQLVLQDRVQVGLLLVRRLLLLLFLFLLRDQKVVLLYALELLLSSFLRLLEEVFGARSYLQGRLQLLNFTITVLYVLHLLQHLVALVLVLG